jgi:hypothetical protein
MRPSESARAAPARAERDPRIDLLPGKIECTDSLFDIGRQAGRIVLGVDLGVFGALAVLTAVVVLVSVGDMPALADGSPEGARVWNARLSGDIADAADLAASHAGSVANAARRGDRARSRSYLVKLRLAVMPALNAYNGLAPESDRGGAL